MTLIAFVYFQRQKCEFVILEVGLGGRLDATNVVENVDVSVIVSIGFDHMELLGYNAEAIASEKAGILRYKTPVVIGPSACGLRSVVEAAEEMDAPIFAVPGYAGMTFDDENSLIARKVLDVMDLPLQELPISRALAHRPFLRFYRLSLFQMQSAASHITRFLQTAFSAHQEALRFVKSYLSANANWAVSEDYMNYKEYWQAMPFQTFIYFADLLSATVAENDRTRLMAEVKRLHGYVDKLNALEYFQHVLACLWGADVRQEKSQNVSGNPISTGGIPDEEWLDAIGIEYMNALAAAREKFQRTSPIFHQETMENIYCKLATECQALREISRYKQIFPVPVAVIVDVGHNRSAIRRVLIQCRSEYPDTKIRAVVALSKGRRVEMLEEFVEILRTSDCDKPNLLAGLWLVEAEHERCLTLSMMLADIIDQAPYISNALTEMLLNGFEEMFDLMDSIFPVLPKLSADQRCKMCQTLRELRESWSDYLLELLESHDIHPFTAEKSDSAVEDVSSWFFHTPELRTAQELVEDPSETLSTESGEDSMRTWEQRIRQIEDTLRDKCIPRGSLQWILSVAFHRAAAECSVLLVTGSFFMMCEVLSTLGSFSWPCDPFIISDPQAVGTSKSASTSVENTLLDLMLSAPVSARAVANKRGAVIAEDFKNETLTLMEEERQRELLSVSRKEFVEADPKLRW